MRLTHPWSRRRPLYPDPLARALYNRFILNHRYDDPQVGEWVYAISCLPSSLPMMVAKIDGEMVTLSTAPRTFPFSMVMSVDALAETYILIPGYTPPDSFSA